MFLLNWTDALNWTRLVIVESVQILNSHTLPLPRLHLAAETGKPSGADAPESFGQVAGWLQAGSGPEFNADVPRSEQVLVAVIRAEFNADPARIQICADAGQVRGVDAGRVRRADAPENLPRTSQKLPEHLSIMSRELPENSP